jgi:Tol biopolymer transport system component
MKKFILLHLALLLFLTSASAQYFGKNKPRYRSFDFKIAETPHFQVHYYMNNPEMISFVSRLSEQWYTNHKNIFGQELSQKVPVILYNNHPEFQQTNTISGEIGVGTGGVTEALKTRVVLPISFSNQGTNHVLVHELVHAFQYDAILNGDSTSLQSLSNLPLWMIEGMAEYFSLGRMDPFTSMWMRDAILNDKLPEIKKLNDNRYFPNRYGHSLIAFLGGFYGDTKLRDLFINAAKYGLDQSFITTYGLDSKTISSLWHNAMKTFYAPLLEGNKEKPRGKKLLSEENAGTMNISPAISTNGRYVIFMSEKDLFTTELYLADATSGAIIRKITSLTGQGDLDYINGFESTGSWAPDNRTFSFVGVHKGKNVLVTIDALSGKSLHTVSIPRLDAFVSPVYHPSGKEIIVTGSKEGKTDLYSYNLKTKKVKQLTDDTYSELLPCFSPDGNSLVFMYDKASFSHQRFEGRYTHDLAIMDFDSGAIKTLSVFKNADHINPVYDHEGNILFVSDYDGLRNLYKYDTASGNLLQLTRLLTGISGITATSPMISASTKKDRLLYTHFFNGSYSIFSADAADWLNLDVSPENPPAQNWGVLPVQMDGSDSLVQQSFSSADEDLAGTNPAIVSRNYAPRFKLDYIGGGGGIGVGVNNNSFRNAAGL